MVLDLGPKIILCSATEIMAWLRIGGWRGRRRFTKHESAMTTMKVVERSDGVGRRGMGEWYLWWIWGFGGWEREEDNKGRGGTVKDSSRRAYGAMVVTWATEIGISELWAWDVRGEEDEKWWGWGVESWKKKMKYGCLW